MRLSWTIGVIAVLLGCRDGAQGTVSPNAFTDGLVALVQNVDDPAWPHDAVTIDSAAVSREDTLRLVVRFGGGCRTHRFALLLGNAFMESHPVQVHARLAHDADGDMCRALLTRSLEFDLTALKRRYKESYGPGPATILINLAEAPQVRYSFR